MLLNTTWSVPFLVPVVASAGTVTVMLMYFVSNGARMMLFSDAETHGAIFPENQSSAWTDMLNVLLMVNPRIPSLVGGTLPKWRASESVLIPKCSETLTFMGIVMT